jgi:hypothetical protein
MDKSYRQKTKELLLPLKNLNFDQIKFNKRRPNSLYDTEVDQAFIKSSIENASFNTLLQQKRT